MCYSIVLMFDFCLVMTTDQVTNGLADGFSWHASSVIMLSQGSHDYDARAREPSALVETFSRDL